MVKTYTQDEIDALLEQAKVDVKAIGDALLFLVERCNEQGFYSPIKQPIVQTALAAIRARGEK